VLFRSRGAVDECGLLVESAVDLEDLAGGGGEELRDGLDRLDRSEDVVLAELRSD
jgi:hypothetical protein